MKNTIAHRPNILLIGGATRNVGKTSFTCSVIKHFAEQASIVGLKIKTIRQGDQAKHGKGRHLLTGDYLVCEESYTNNEDTGRMYEAGAKRVFHIKAHKHALGQAIENFFALVGSEAIIICESNSLRQIIEPGVFLMIKKKDAPHDMKPSAEQLQQYVDHTIWSDGTTHDTTPHILRLNALTWEINTTK